MIKITSILGMSRICLISFILLCSVFTSENAFSIQWSKRIAPVEYNRKDNAIYFSFPFHQYTPDSGEFGYLKWCHFSYFLSNNYYYLKLMSVETKYQEGADRVSILLCKKNLCKYISYYTPQNPTKGTPWLDATDITVEVDVTKFKAGLHEATSKLGYISIKWDLSKTYERVKYFKIIGLWSTNSLRQVNDFELVYPMENVVSNTNTTNYAPSELNSEISNNVKVTGETDTITITGAEQGENIKVYTVSGIVIKSVVANDDVVNIKLAKNQIYIVKAGQARYKIAL